MTLKDVVRWITHAFTSTVFDGIWPSVVFLTLVATLVQCVTAYSDTSLAFNNVNITAMNVLAAVIISFKATSFYGRWYDGRNIWSVITANTRQLAMLLWLQVPNSSPEIKRKPKPKSRIPSYPKTRLMSHIKKRKWSGSPITVRPRTRSDGHTIVTSPISPKGDRMDERGLKRRPRVGRVKPDVDEVKQRAELRGLIEKKTYIGLIEAFAVSLKHALRGETGPFYSDLYPLIAFLPKYNPSSDPATNRDDLMSLWHDGIPRQHPQHKPSTRVVPLTNPATCSCGALLNTPETGTSSCTSSYSSTCTCKSPDTSSHDVEKDAVGITTSSNAFWDQALTSVANFTRSDNPDVTAYARLDESHRVGRVDGSVPSNRAETVRITTVELMPPQYRSRSTSGKTWLSRLRMAKNKIAGLFTDRRNRLDSKPWKRKAEQPADPNRNPRQKPCGIRTEIPQECLMYISAWLTDLHDRNLFKIHFASPTMTCIMELQKALSDIDKLATTPVPADYIFYLHMTMMVWLFFVPFQLQELLDWMTIPATAIIATIYLGFLEIGNHLDFPFANDLGNLDLDTYVLKIAMQLAEITAFPTAMPTSHVVLSHLNQPFLPSISINAPTLLGLSEPIPRPTFDGFAHAFTHDIDDSPNDLPLGRRASNTGHLPKTMRDLEVAMGANWQEIIINSRRSMRGYGEEAEKRTGMEVAVLAL